MAVVATYIRNVLGDMVDEIDPAATTDFVYAPAGALHGEPEARIAAVAAGSVSAMEYFHTGPLGTTRALTDATGNDILQGVADCSYEPNGQMLAYAPFRRRNHRLHPNENPVQVHRTIPRRRNRPRRLRCPLLQLPTWALYESGLVLRPQPVPYADLTSPQSLNLYAYAGNNPTTNTDADGHREDLYFQEGATLNFGTDQDYSSWWNYWNWWNGWYFPAPGNSGYITFGGNKSAYGYRSKDNANERRARSTKLQLIAGSCQPT